MVNSGRFSMPCAYDVSALNGPDALPGGPARSRVGSVCPDAPVADGYLLDQLGNGFVLLGLGVDVPEALDEDGIALRGLTLTAEADSDLAARYLGEAAQAVYLIRPDQHVAARWDSYDETALRKACGKG